MQLSPKNKTSVWTKVGLVLLAILVAVFAFTSFWFYSRVFVIQLKYDVYVANHHNTDSEYDQVRFSFYYVKPKQKLGVDDLRDDLDGLEWIKPYEEGVFDCSEMSAFLERHLENKGWHTKIIIGDSPFGSGRHAWLLVETSEDHYMPVESTNIEIVWWEDQNFDNYFDYDHAFDTIQEALTYDESGFDWWE